MKNIIRLLTLSIVAAGIMLGTFVYSYAAETQAASENAPTSDLDKNASERLRGTFKIMLDTYNWTTIVSDNNFWPARIEVTADNSNPGDLEFRIVNDINVVISGPHNVPPGFSAATSNIPAFSRTWTLQMKARSMGGWYSGSYFD